MGGAGPGDPLRLRAADAEDVAVFAAHVQDAIVQIGDMAYLPAKRRFAMVMNRFMWEDLQPTKGPHADDDAPYRRTRTAMHFDGVLGAKTQRLKLNDKTAVTNLLTVNFDEGQEGAGVIELVFSGGAAIRLDVECVDGWLSDMGAPWATKNLPKHEPPGGGAPAG
jgi:hypothetical protein